MLLKSVRGVRGGCLDSQACSGVVLETVILSRISSDTRYEKKKITVHSLRRKDIPKPPHPPLVVKTTLTALVVPEANEALREPFFVNFTKRVMYNYRPSAA